MNPWHWKSLEAVAASIKPFGPSTEKVSDYPEWPRASVCAEASFMHQQPNWRYFRSMWVRGRER